MKDSFLEFDIMFFNEIFKLLSSEWLIFHLFIKV